MSCRLTVTAVFAAVSFLCSIAAQTGSPGTCILAGAYGPGADWQQQQVFMSGAHWSACACLQQGKQHLYRTGQPDTAAANEAWPQVGVLCARLRDTCPFSVHVLADHVAGFHAAVKDLVVCRAACSGTCAGRGSAVLGKVMCMFARCLRMLCQGTAFQLQHYQ
jgi:hypothetical protein